MSVVVGYRRIGSPVNKEEGGVRALVVQQAKQRCPTGGVRGVQVSTLCDKFFDDFLVAASCRCMERRFPGFTDSVELTKVLTPLSYERFSVLNKGSWRGFAPTVFSMKNRIPHFGSSCKGLYFCGQSIAVGGGIDAVTEDAFQTAEWIAARERF